MDDCQKDEAADASEGDSIKQGHTTRVWLPTCPLVSFRVREIHSISLSSQWRLRISVCFPQVSKHFVDLYCWYVLSKRIADVMQQVVERVSVSDSEQQDSGLRPQFLRLPHPRTGTSMQHPEWVIKRLKYLNDDLRATLPIPRYLYHFHFPNSGIAIHRTSQSPLMVPPIRRTGCSRYMTPLASLIEDLIIPVTHEYTDGKLLLMTPIDPALLLIPLLHLKHLSVSQTVFVHILYLVPNRPYGCLLTTTISHFISRTREPNDAKCIGGQ